MLSFLLTLVDEQHRDIVQYIYDMYHDDMIRFARHKLRIAGVPSYDIDAQDAVQSAFLKICKYYKAILEDIPEKQFKSYIFAIVKNESKDIIKGNKRFEIADENLETLPDEEFLERLKIKEQYDDVMDAIKKLDDKYSFTLLFYYVEEMSVKNIAENMEIPEKTVYTRLERGRALLLETLNKEKSI